VGGVALTLQLLVFDSRISFFSQKNDGGGAAPGMVNWVLASHNHRRAILLLVFSHKPAHPKKVARQAAFLWIGNVGEFSLLLR